MIQDIEPHHLDNQYKPVPPDKDSIALYYEDHAALMKVSEKGISFPSFADLEHLNREIYKECIYLFSVDDERYYLVNEIDRSMLLDFQMKNTKGRFRFYRELLSSSMDLCSEQVISDASLNHACKIAMKDYLRTELKEDSAASSVGKSRTNIVFRRFGKAVAVAAITITLLFSTAMVANAQFREKVIAWVVETFEKYSIFELQSDGENTQPDLQSYKPTYLPDGAELQNTVELPEFYGYEYAIDDTAYFSIWLSQSDIRIYIDAENADVEPFDKDGITGYFFKKEDLNYVCFERDGCSFSVYGLLDMDELIKIAAGITKE